MTQRNSTIMKLAFAAKIALVILILAVGVTATSLYLFYSQTHEMVLGQMQSKLVQLGNAGTFLFSETDRIRLKRLIEAIAADAQPISASLQIPEGETLPSLSPADEAKYIASEDFQYIVQRLRQIKEASRQTIEPLQHLPQYQQKAYATDPPSIIFTYIIITLPEFPNGRIIKFIADSDYEAMPDEDANPPGNLFGLSSSEATGIHTLVEPIFTQQPAVAEAFDTDKWGTYLSSAIPIKDSDGSVIAVLGLDLNASSEANKINGLRWLAGSIIGISMVLAMLAAWWLARWLSQPVTQICQAAARVRDGDYTTTVSIHSRDELELLGETFNHMVVKIRENAQQLEQKVAERTAALAQANDAITQLNKKLEKENLRMSAELDVTRQLQQMVLPESQELQQIKDLDIAGFMEPAEEVGGDYYDVLQYDGRLKIGIGDVTGHGLASGVLMLMVQTAVRTLATLDIKSASQFLTTLNQVIYENVNRMKTDKNLTLSLFDYQNGRLRLYGQHEEVLLVRSGGQVERLNTMDLGFVVGLVDDIAPFVAQKEVELSAGDGVVLFTDGITEAMNTHRKFYGVERLCQVIAEYWHLTAVEIQQAVIADVRHYTGGEKLRDDITLLVIKQK